MERRQILKSVGLAATASLAGLAGCSSPNSGTGSETDTTPTPSGQSPTGTETSQQGGTPIVQMGTGASEYYFDPIGLFVESGTTVTFRIESGSHSATAYQEGNGPASVTRIPEAAQAWDSGILSERGATFEHTFETSGTHDYYCIPHKTLGMVGRIVVDEPGGPAEGSMPPDGKVPESQTIVEQGTVPYSDFSG